MKSKIILLIFLCGVLYCLDIHAQYKLPAGVFGNGGAASGAGEFRMAGTAGQALCGESASPAFRQGAGFWYAHASLITSVARRPFGQQPAVYKLHQNYPNPFNPSSVIAYDLPETSEVTIAVYDVRGNLTETLFHGVNLPGVHKAVFQPGRVASGMYLFRLSAKSIDTGKTFYDVKKATFVK
ncbi:MAG TPA: T9SS type A sorting domain-containing protein [bacterium]